MSDSDVIDRIWTIADKLDPCMFVTRDGDGQRVRPVYARVRRDEGAIYVLSDSKGCKLDQIEAYPHVSLAFSDERANDYVVINGVAEARHDPEKARDVWRFSDETFFKSPDNPDLRVITVRPVSAELWDGSNLLISGAKLLAERLLGAKTQLVENARIDRLQP
ncbi:pyridoxamine 5'-phosphate oxidase family protein [Paracoccus sp. AK26]|uniref:pyridoxamine 5'-phosphate oxidase family protein n=1 Tax=Paracoccus sp. AK26 TaxID=2589076 RepID=UPI0014287419|nr:pyridoxamine 5'-phosphate oxidase family protein [Paracoccus sp. AK26]QIR84130.1 general stress protein [Paracoccus sp. AK26]